MPRKFIPFVLLAIAVVIAVGIFSLRSYRISQPSSLNSQETDSDNDKDEYNSSVDCDDNDKNVNPSVEEICGNKTDDNCNGKINEGCVVNKNIINVPEDYSAIQEAINKAKKGQTIKVAPGIYNENITLKEGINVIGTKAESTIIDGESRGDVVLAKKDVTRVTKISGFTIRGSKEDGAGIKCESSSPVIESNIFTKNSYGVFAGENSSPLISGNIFEWNSDGILVYHLPKNASSDNSETVIIRNVIVYNKHGINVNDSRAKIINNVISYNTNYPGNTSGIFVNRSRVTITNNIITDNGYHSSLCSGIGGDKDSFYDISYNDVWNNRNNYRCYGKCSAGVGDISKDPLFIDPENGDFHLKSNSPCKGAGKDGAEMGAY